MSKSLKKEVDSNLAKTPRHPVARALYKSGVTQLTEFTYREPHTACTQEKNQQQCDHDFEQLRDGVIGTVGVCRKELESAAAQAQAVSLAPCVLGRRVGERLARLAHDVTLFFDSYRLGDLSAAQRRLDEERLRHADDYQARCAELERRLEAFEDQRAMMGTNLLRIDQLQAQNGQLAAKVDVQQRELEELEDRYRQTLRENAELQARLGALGREAARQPEGAARVPKRPARTAPA